MLLGRLYFAVQAVLGSAWWVCVALVPAVRDATLGELDPVLVAIFDIPLFVVASAISAWGIRIAALVATGWTALVAVALAIYATFSTHAGWGALIMLAAAGASVLALCLMLWGRIPTRWIARGPFAFRTARPAPHVLLTLLQMLVFWGIFLVLLPSVIVVIEQRWGLSLQLGPVVQYLGIGLLGSSSALGVWSAVTMAARGNGTPLPAAMPVRLVIAGPYRFVRNPMAVAGIVQGVAVGLLLSSWLVVVYAVAGSVLWNYAVRPLEETDLQRRFGIEFEQYQARVRCWIPRIF